MLVVAALDGTEDIKNKQLLVLVRLLQVLAVYNRNAKISETLVAVCFESV